MKFLNKVTSCAAAALILLITAPATMAASWPTANDKITIVVPFKTGGSTDRLARSIAQYLPKHLNGAPVTVVNKPGASGAVGSSWFLNQPDDGHTFLVTHGVPYLANNVLLSDLPMKWEDFEFINIQWPQSSLLFVNKNEPYKTAPELFEAIRDNPGKISASILQGSGAHLQLLLMMDALKIPRSNVRWVTYEGGGPQRTAVAGGNVTFTMTAAKGSKGIADKITPLAINSKSGYSAFPGVPHLNTVLKENYGISVPPVANTYASLIAHASFSKKHPARFEAFVGAYEKMIKSSDYKDFISKGSLGAEWTGPKASKEILDEGFKTMETYKDTYDK
jgi:tripartite-type tricarboxylate transporter receptor subunit TctC